MLPKKGQVWTYRERSRLLSLIRGSGSIVLVAFGIYFGVTGETWGILIFALIALAGFALFFFSNERKYRGEP
ncbi:hypothetical protein GCM10027404_33300 [Arthrobacter tumbae]|nr:hypothetical protein [Arthrobacter tumbae]